MKLTKKKEKEVTPRGFERGLVPEKILGATDSKVYFKINTFDQNYRLIYIDLFF